MTEPVQETHYAYDGYWRRLYAPCPVPVGTRVRLVEMGADPDPIEVGTEGTVTGGTGAQVWVDWDNGRTLNLLVDIDKYEKIEATS